MKYYLVPKATDASQWAKIGASGFVPAASIPLSAELAQEDERVLTVTQELNEFSEQTYVVTVNQELKSQLAQQAAANEAAQAVRNVVRNARAFGQQLVEDFTVENLVLGITADGMTGLVLDRLAPVLLALNSGSLHEAIARARAVPAEHKDAKYITNGRLLAAVNKLEQYLGLPLSTEL